MRGWPLPCVWLSHNFTVLSSLAEARVLPSDENATDKTRPQWPERVATSLRVALSHNFTVLSSLAEARVLPSDENATATALTDERVATSLRVAVPQLHCVVITGGGQSLAVRRKRHRQDTTAMAREGGHFLARGAVP